MQPVAHRRATVRHHASGDVICHESPTLSLGSTAVYTGTVSADGAGREGRRSRRGEAAAAERGDPRQARGRAAENAAAAFLVHAGLRVIDRNVRLPEGEIDLVCQDGDTLVFVEVKARDARWGDDPGAAVSWWKQRRLTRLALHYLKWKGRIGTRCRFDVAAVTVGPDGVLAVRHIRSAFDAVE
ncbi:MAG: YraN family protein [Candidatus Rokubacteria bacterium]|nr:YraN family protein [Candidatus Rokubacteria bacterium]